MSKAAFSVILSIPAGAMSSQTPVSGAGQTGPPFLDTVQFMNLSVSAEQSSVSSANRCEITIVRNRLYNFVIPKDVYSKSTDSYGVQHYGYHWAQFSEQYRLVQFHLENIDPSSILSKPVASPDFIREHDVDKYPDELKTPDLYVVFYQSRDLKTTLASGDFKRAQDGSIRANLTDNKPGGFIVFESKDRAERFVTAFTHAVNLCGGKMNDFAPTPSK